MPNIGTVTDSNTWANASGMNSFTLTNRHINYIV